MDDIPKASVVFVENPIIQSLNVPLVQCEVCYSQSSQQVYTCLECRRKTYCSLSCLEKDKIAHEDECIGYQELTLLVLDASSLFRAFTRISRILHENIFNSKIFRKLKTAEDVWNELLKRLEEEPTVPANLNYLNLIRTHPLYVRLTEMQYSTLVTTAFRLTLFIEKKTNLIEKYFKKLQVSNKQKLMLVGAILMRIHGNMLLNSFDFEITKQTTSNKRTADGDDVEFKQIETFIKSIKPKREVLVENLDKFYRLDTKTDIWDRSTHIIESQKNVNQVTLSTLPKLKHVLPCNRIHRVLSTFKDAIAELYFNPQLHSVLYGQAASQPTSSISAKIICERIADMNYLERCLFVKKFARNFHNHYVEYFLHLIERNGEVQQVLTLHCPTLAKFKHSCVPNVEVIVLDNGVVIGKALRNIKNGEQLFVSYKAHYMRHVRMEREVFLRRLDIKCECKYCRVDNIEEPTNSRLAIFCESCNGIKITPAYRVCPKCHTQYNNLLNKYRTIIHILEMELKNNLMSENVKAMTERDVYILHRIIFSHSKLYYGPQNEFRISIELRMARYLALQNFAKQSYSLIKEIRNNILKSYDENSIWFTYYADILLIVKIILFYNLEERQYTLPSDVLMDVCNLGLHIANGQKDFIEFYEIFDKECSYILDDINSLLKWKDIISCTDLMPMADLLSKSKKLK